MEHDAFQLHRCCILSSLAVPLTREVLNIKFSELLVMCHARISQ